MDEPTLQNLIDYLQAWDDALGTWRADFMEYLQQTDRERFAGLWHFQTRLGDSVLTALRVILRERFGGCSLQSILAARDVACTRLHIPTDAANRLTLQQFVESISDPPVGEGSAGYLPASLAARAFGLTLPEINRLATTGAVRSRQPTADQREGRERLQVHAEDLSRCVARSRDRQ